jgi:3-hydroxyisobutyrate dehydrogenase
MVSDSNAVEQVMQGVLQTLKPGSIVIDMSTIAPDVTRKLAESVRQRGADILDAPVSGGVAGAAAGTLAIMVGGSEATYERALPILQVLGKKIQRMGDIGMGQTTKLCNQVIGMGTLLAVAEGLKLARAAGADLNQIIEVVGAGAGGSWQLANTGKLIAADDWRAGFRVTLALKDLRLALAEAKRLGLDLDGALTTACTFASLVEAGDGDLGVQRLGKGD